MEDVCKVDTRGGKVEGARVYDHIKSCYISQVEIVVGFVDQNAMLGVVCEVQNWLRINGLCKKKAKFACWLLEF